MHKLINESEYEVIPVENDLVDIWIKTKNIMTHIYETDEGIVTDLSAIDETGDGPMESLASTYALFADAAESLAEMKEGIKP